MSRTIVWFSCGIASAVAAKLAVKEYGDEVVVVYCNTMRTEHPDNQRFFNDVQTWIGKPITIIKSSKYETVDDVFEQTRYLSGPKGARCTVEMKKIPRFEFQHPYDVHIFGFTLEEWKRVKQFQANNHDLKLEWILVKNMLAREDCLSILKESGIELPVMYQLGFRNNNCIGCVKASSAKYWNMIRKHFPEVFERRAKLSRELGARLVWYKGRRIFLDELPPDQFSGELENISCGPECGG